jgi:hypothetical protein
MASFRSGRRGPFWRWRNRRQRSRNTIDRCDLQLARDNQDMNRNVLYLVIGALVVAAGVFGYMLYQERQKTTGIEINVGKSGISIEKK